MHVVSVTVTEENPTITSEEALQHEENTHTGHITMHMKTLQLRPSTQASAPTGRSHSSLTT